MVFNTTSDPRRPAAASAPRPLVATIGQPPSSAAAWRYCLALVRREAPRRLLWLPVALATGIGVYFASPVEPAAGLGPGLAAVAATVAVALRRSRAVVWIALLIAAAAVGFSVAEQRTRFKATVMLEREIWASIEGVLTAVERRPADWRLTLAGVTVIDGASTQAPSGVRVTIAGASKRQAGNPLSIGDRVRLRARLGPPPPPAAPGAFDFQRDAYFRGIGAIGFVVGPVEVLEPAPAGAGAGVRAMVDRVRDRTALRIREVLPGPAGAVAAAMLIGDRAGIDETTAQAFRETGLAHLLAISGLHMGLVAGTVFVTVRTALAAWPAVALRRPIKKWSAAVALLAAAGYLLLAGAPVPTQRAFMMTAVVLVGVLLDRETLSLHLVAWAAAAVLLLAPESLVGPSFQLSFAAVIALIAVWEVVAVRRRARPRRRSGPLRRTAGYVGGVAATSLVASLATAPIVAHHFQQVPVLGAVANLAAVPVTAFLTMPAGVLGLLTMPVGLETWPLRLMGLGIDATLWAAEVASKGPLTAVGVPALGTASMVVLALGGLWLALWRTRIRWLGAGLVGVGLIIPTLDRLPDALISADGDLTAVRVPGTGWAVSRESGSRFVHDTWRRRWGGDAGTTFLELDNRVDGTAAFGCDGLGCVVRFGNRLLALAATPEAAVEDCARADVVVTATRLRDGCDGGAIVIDRDDLRREGAHAIWLSQGAIRVRSVNASRGLRPWVIRPGSPIRTADD